MTERFALSVMNSGGQVSKVSASVAAVQGALLSLGSLRSVVLMTGAAALMIAGAQVRFVVPGTDVPMTLQPIAMLLVGMTMAVPVALGGMSFYVALGGLGLPVFAGDGGLTGSTAGYLIGFAAGATVVSCLARGGRCSYARLVLSGLAGMAVLIGCGVLWRVPLFGGAFGLALVTGAWPFLLKALIEAALAASVAHRWNKRVLESRSLSIHGV